MNIDNLSFIAAAYVICCGALGSYVWSLQRRRDGE